MHTINQVLLESAQTGDMMGVQHSLQAGADPDAQDLSGFTALHYAAKYNNADMCRALLERGASVDKTDNMLNTPLHVAAHEGSLPIAEILRYRICERMIQL